MSSAGVTRNLERGMTLIANAFTQQQGTVWAPAPAGWCRPEGVPVDSHLAEIAVWSNTNLDPAAGVAAGPSHADLPPHLTLLLWTDRSQGLPLTRAKLDAMREAAAQFTGEQFIVVGAGFAAGGNGEVDPKGALAQLRKALVKAATLVEEASSQPPRGTANTRCHTFYSTGSNHESLTAVHCTAGVKGGKLGLQACYNDSTQPQSEWLQTQIGCGLATGWKMTLDVHFEAQPAPLAVNERLFHALRWLWPLDRGATATAVAKAEAAVALSPAAPGAGPGADRCLADKQGLSDEQAAYAVRALVHIESGRQLYFHKKAR